MCVRGKRSLSRLLRNSNRLAALQLPWDRRRAGGHTLTSGSAISFRQATCVQARELWAAVWMACFAGAEPGRPLPTPSPRENPGNPSLAFIPAAQTLPPRTLGFRCLGIVSLVTFKLTGTDLWCSFEIFAGEEGVDS